MTLKFTALPHPPPSPFGTVTFGPGNGIQYMQDFSCYRGVPDGVEFRVFDADSCWRLVAPGYGETDGGGYGNGALLLPKEGMVLELKGALAHA